MPAECLYPSCTPAVMVQPNKHTIAAADPHAAPTTAFKSMMPSQPAINLKTPTFE